MKKFTAVLLAAVLTVCVFSIVTGVPAEEINLPGGKSYGIEACAAEGSALSESSLPSSEDSNPAPERVNLASGRPYTLSCDDDNPDFISTACPDPDRKLLTDGKIRPLSRLTAGGEGAKAVTVEFVGTNRTHCADIGLDGLNTVDSVVLEVARRGNNRYANVPKIEVKTDGRWQNAAFTEKAVPIKDAPQYSPEKDAEGKDQFFTLEYSFNPPIENAEGVKVYLNTDPGANADRYALSGRGYVVQLDEIKVMGTRTGEGESSAPVNPPGPPTGDAGLGIFAILAVISLAGAAIAKKAG